MRSVIATLVLGIGLAATVQADGIYKWVDENGVVHFGSQPPKQEQVEVVKPPKSDRFKQWQQEQNALVAERKLATGAEAGDSDNSESTPASQSKTDEDQSAKQADARAAEMAARDLRCRNAQARLQELQSRPRVREVDAKGNYRVLPEEERQQRIRQTKDLLQNDC
ncbi:DUF4124 domain-containing protein [Microbulbifer pacificus]|uniref:DUF4124 domain-containing protein n=1 Tax=Microbulbifer pacificus TaxID=407164 RepID=A0AAU0N335_9GAMM|nr:DUF4124 domain-containing protein [Microbulbifer pacificus]WOX06673.1 DUF4124 domain-containing protein [Microbulbifer pacificus]